MCCYCFLTFALGIISNIWNRFKNKNISKSAYSFSDSAIDNIYPIYFIIFNLSINQCITFLFPIHPWPLFSLNISICVSSRGLLICIAKHQVEKTKLCFLVKKWFLGTYYTLKLLFQGVGDIICPYLVAEDIQGLSF